MEFDIFDMQYKFAFKTGKESINNLKQSEGLFIINKDMKARVLFYYKPETYFLSDKIDLNLSHIDLDNSKDLEDICEFISMNFDDTKLLRKSILVKDIDFVVKKYLIGSLVLYVNRMNNKILKRQSLEFYNDLLVINMNGILKLSRLNNKIVYNKINISGTKNGVYNLQDILEEAYESQSTYPHEYIQLDYDNFSTKDVIPTNISPIIAFPSISSENLICFGFVSLKDDIKYKNTDVLGIMNQMIDSVNTSDDVENDIKNILDELYCDYEPVSQKLLN